jgi:hypothetical protein
MEIIHKLVTFLAALLILTYAGWQVYLHQNMGANGPHPCTCGCEETGMCVCQNCNIGCGFSAAKTPATAACVQSNLALNTCKCNTSCKCGTTCGCTPAKACSAGCTCCKCAKKCTCANNGGKCECAKTGKKCTAGCTCVVKAGS